MMENSLRKCQGRFMKCSVGLFELWWAKKLQCRENLKGVASLQQLNGATLINSILATLDYQQFRVVTNPTLGFYIPWTRD